MWWAGEIDASRFAAEIIENAGEGIVVYDRELRCLLWNRFMEGLAGPPDGNVFAHHAEIARAMAGETVVAADLHHEGRWISAVYRPHVAGVVGLFHDITERKNAEQQIEYQAYHDALTGLANRRLFQEHLSIALALAARRQRTVAVLFLDLDHFKVVNDTLGHTMGDALLRLVAARLKACVHDGDTVARVGGDE